MRKKECSAKVDTTETSQEVDVETNNAEQVEDLAGCEELDVLTKRLSEAEALKDQAISIAQRLQADFDNFKKRTAKARAEALNEGTMNVIASILPVIDNFDRAFCYVDENSDDAFVKGMQMVFSQLMDILSRQGLSEIDTCGKFDPCFHEAILQDTSSGEEAGTITEVLQKGYMVCDRVIRHSKVKVTV